MFQLKHFHYPWCLTHVEYISYLITLFFFLTFCALILFYWRTGTIFYSGHICCAVNQSWRHQWAIVPCWFVPRTVNTEKATLALIKPRSATWYKSKQASIWIYFVPSLFWTFFFICLYINVFKALCRVEWSASLWFVKANAVHFTCH